MVPSSARNLGIVLVVGALSFVPFRARASAQATWKAKCAMCHGADGKADTSMGRHMKIADLTSAAWQKSVSDAEIRQTIVDGVHRTKDGVHQMMSGFGGRLSDAEISALVGTVRDLGPKRPNAAASPAKKAPAAPSKATSEPAKGERASAKKPKSEATGAYSAYVLSYSAKRHRLEVILPVAASVPASALRRHAHVRLQLDPKTGEVTGVETPREKPGHHRAKHTKK